MKMEEETSVVRKRRHLSPEEKFQIFVEAIRAKENGAVGEVLRRWGIHSSDLVRIKRTVEESSIEAFRERKSRKAKVEVDQALQREKERLEATILEQAAELALLKKKSAGVKRLPQRAISFCGREGGIGLGDWGDSRDLRGHVEVLL